MPDAPLSEPVAAPRTGWRHVFFGAARLRAGWRLALYFVAGIPVSAVVLPLMRATRSPTGDYPSPPLGPELLVFGLVVAVTAIVARVDRLPFARFGLPWRRAFGALFWEGSLWGFGAVVVLVAAIAALGGYHIHGWTSRGGALSVDAFLWLASMVLVGFSREALIRGYPLAALADGIGFWPASAVLSIWAVTASLVSVVNGTHALSAGLIGLLMCFMLRRTGSLWFAIGFHFAFEFGAIPFFGAPDFHNHGRPVDPRLLDSSFTGPEWLTGGACGIEASWLVFAVIAALFALFHRRFPAARFPPPAES